MTKANGLSLMRIKAKLFGLRLPEQYHPRNILRLTAVPSGLRDPEFVELVPQIDSGPVHTGNKIELLVDGGSAFGAAHEAIERSCWSRIIATCFALSYPIGITIRIIL